MIVFDLRCGRGHVFEAWFGSGAAYEEQKTADQLACPMCGSTDVGKAVMAPAVPSKGDRADPPSPAAVKQALRMLAAEQTKALEKSEWVGAAFASRARAMHSGEEEKATIHGQTTLAEAKALADEGVPVTPLPLPITPPDQMN